MKNLKKKLSHMIENELQPMPKTKTKHLRQLFNQPKFVFVYLQLYKICICVFAKMLSAGPQCVF